MRLMTGAAPLCTMLLHPSLLISLMQWQECEFGAGDSSDFIQTVPLTLCVTLEKPLHLCELRPSLWT